MEELDPGGRCVHERAVDRPACEDAAHRHGAAGDAFRERDEIGRDAEELARERLSEPPEPGDHLVEDEEDPVPVADLAQPLQVSARRDEHPTRAGHRFDDHRGDVRGIVERDDPVLELVGQVGAGRRLAAHERPRLEVLGVPQVVDARQQAGGERFPVRRDTAHRDPAEIGAVERALAADEPGARRLAPQAVVRECDLERGLHRFRARIGEERVPDAFRRERDEAVRGLERKRVAERVRRSVVEHPRLPADRRHDLRPAMPRIHAPQGGETVEHLLAVGGRVVHVLRADDEPRRPLERAVRGERHPVGIEVEC